MERALITIHGIVQGVGFRPFVHKLARAYCLAGTIKNTSSGVELELEGARKELERFVSDIPVKAPKLALIESVEATYGLESRGMEGFTILASRTEQERNTLISPDIGICDDCRRELFTLSDRRYHYPFINCTNCGPRFTIVQDVPYDRARTSMSKFPMCPDCSREYQDIEDRRYHAQPDACGVCGPHLQFLSGDMRIEDDDDRAIEEARKRILSGQIIAVKGIGGMHLACLPERAEELRRRKHRDEKPFAVMCADTECAGRICRISQEEQSVLESYHKPIVLLQKKDRNDKRLSAVSENQYVGVMLPYTPLHALLLNQELDTLIMTSANCSDMPIMYRNEEALNNLDGIADGFLLHNRDIQTRCDDSLCWVVDGNEYFARRSRGYVPFPIRLNRNLGSLLALGAEQKASFCMSKGNYVFASQHIGDLKNLETYCHYTEQIDHFKRLFDISPVAVACDLHPDYLSTAYGEEQNLPLVRVQHHHAHMASCMADNHLEGEVIGLIWDGTGYGEDGTIWGGECLVGGYERFERFSYLRPIPLLGGDAAVKDLDRVAYVLSGREDNPLYEKMLRTKMNCPLSSGMGRLFDGAAAMLGICRQAGYEGQGAVLLESVADDSVKDHYPVEFDGKQFDWRPMTRALQNETDAAAGAARFMNTLMEMARVQCLQARTDTSLNRVVLSGGSFQNMYILKRLPELLRKEGFEVFHHQRVSCNDEGISLGQICVLQSRLK